MKTKIIATKYIVLCSILAIIACILFIPIIFMTLVSLIDSSLGNLDLDTYYNIWQYSYLKSYISSIKIAFITFLITAVISTALAFSIDSIRSSKIRFTILTAIVLPYLLNTVIKINAIKVILSSNGSFNSSLIFLKIIQEPLNILYNQHAVYIGLSYILLPFMFIPVYISVSNINKNLIDSGKDLGAKSYSIFFKIQLPLTAQGISNGLGLVFMPAICLYYIPDILGGAKVKLIGNIIADNIFINLPHASAISITLVILSLLIYMTTRHISQKVFKY